jgi:hypothetical protein
LYVTAESYLKSLSNQNDIFKFADDVNLLVPDNFDVGTETNVENLAILNRLHINVANTEEIVLMRPRPYNCDLV